MTKLRAAVLGSGNIGTDLAIKLTQSELLECTALIGRSLSSAGLARAQQAQLTTSQQTIQAIVDAGPAAFDQDDVAAMLGNANTAVNLMTSGPCSSFAAEPEG